jgi:2-(3-amino-3-carboxypropyl)histidine synthase
MIANPTVPAYRYDPFVQRLFREQYDQVGMRLLRHEAIRSARGATRFAVVLGTLGRQGSTAVVDDVVRRIEEAGKEATIILMSEVRPEKIEAFGGIFDCWVQSACPRLSIDWNYTFARQVPLLTPYELNVLLGHAPSFSVGIGERPKETNPDSTKASEDSSGTSKCRCNESTSRPPSAAFEAACQTACKSTHEDTENIPYPMDFYASADTATHSGPWTPGFHLRPSKKPATTIP